jgi:hypothetical protein
MHKLLRVCFITTFSIFFVGCSFNSINQVPAKEKEDTLKENSKYCNKYEKIMNYASTYIEKEFEEGYFSKSDIVGAKAQLFLVENNSPTIFAKNINAANESFSLNYELAKKNNCDLKEFNLSPIEKLKRRLKSLEEKKDVK